LFARSVKTNCKTQYSKKAHQPEIERKEKSKRIFF
jgi:hypothetical protein